MPPQLLANKLTGKILDRDAKLEKNHVTVQGFSRSEQIRNFAEMTIDQLLKEWETHGTNQAFLPIKLILENYNRDFGEIVKSAFLNWPPQMFEEYLKARSGLP